MALTVTNTNSLTLLNILNRTSTNQSNSLTRLSTGMRINRAADDPAGLIAMTTMETEMRGVDAAITNNQRTDAMLNVADNALSQVGDLLNEIQTLAQASTNDASLSADEIAANQAQIDNAISAIDRIISTTEFNGTKLLDGSLGIETSGVTKANVTDIQVFSRNTAAGAATLNVTKAAAAELASATIASGSSGITNATTKLEIKGGTGTVVLEVASGATAAQIESQIDSFKSETGVSAYVDGSNKLHLVSTDYGSDQMVSVKVLEGDSTNIVEASDKGVDASIIINGQEAAVDGLNVSFNSNGLSVNFNITESFNSSGSSTSFQVTTDGGATFQLGTESSTRATIGVDGLFAEKLGNSTLGYLNSLKSGGKNELLADPGKAAQVAGAAAKQIARVQGRIGGFQKFQVGAAVSQMNATKESLTSALSVIKDVDYASESAELNRQNVLLQSAISLLGVANQQSSQVLALLR